METIPRRPAELESLRRALDAMPLYTNIIVSPDRRTGIVAQFKDEVGPGGFQASVKFVEDVIAPERDPAIDVWLSGQPS